MRTSIDWFANSSTITLLLLLIAAVGAALLVERFYVIVVRAKNNARPFIERIIQLVRSGKIDDAIKTCASSNAALPDMGLLILRSRSRDETHLRTVATAATLSLVPKLERRLAYLTTLALLAIMIGTLGTLGAVRAALLASHGGSNALTTGLADAVTPLGAGLTIAAVLTAARGYLCSQAESLRQQLGEFSARLINALIDLPDVRLGHR